MLSERNPEEVEKYEAMGIGLPEEETPCIALVNIEHISMINPGTDESQTTIRTISGDFMAKISYRELKKLLTEKAEAVSVI